MDLVEVLGNAEINARERRVQQLNSVTSALLSENLLYFLCAKKFDFYLAFLS